eukprot:363324-Chlamydomonas_euryale.AAC.12
MPLHDSGRRILSISPKIFKATAGNIPDFDCKLKRSRWLPTQFRKGDGWSHPPPWFPHMLLPPCPLTFVCKAAGGHIPVAASSSLTRSLSLGYTSLLRPRTPGPASVSQLQAHSHVLNPSFSLPLASKATGGHTPYRGFKLTCFCPPPGHIPYCRIQGHRWPHPLSRLQAYANPPAVAGRQCKDGHHLCNDTCDVPRETPAVLHVLERSVHAAEVLRLPQLLRKTAACCALCQAPSARSTPNALHPKFHTYLSQIEESHSTLRFASRAKRVVNNAIVNEVLTDAALLKRQAKASMGWDNVERGGMGGLSMLKQLADALWAAALYMQCSAELRASSA